MLLDSELTCKIADFGLSRDMDGLEYYTLHRMAIPVRWSAPEVVNEHKFYKTSDVWSFGILAMEIYTDGEEPYTGWANQRICLEVSAGYRMPCPKGCPEPAYDALIRPCWAHDPTARPSFEDLAQRIVSVFPELAAVMRTSGSSSSNPVPVRRQVKCMNI